MAAEGSSHRMTAANMSSTAKTRPVELKSRLDAGEPLCVLDVREPWEVAISGLPGARHIPLHEIPARLQELDAGAAIIVMCKGGGRSRQAAKYLATCGFSRVSTLAGGIDAWARDVDPGLPTY
jgi:rhodanese-related sulfurtransferase